MSVATNDSPKFDFISDADFRASLESDYRELSNSIEHEAWKAVHVLAGSVVEAILADYLIGIGYQKRCGKDPLKMELGPIISACKDEKIITDRTADLSSVVRSYRNLIHPGRIIRLNEKVDKKSASIAKALVDVVADEVTATKAATYGFTAEQIINKIAKDTSAIAVLSHFLKETNERERERLVEDVIPERFFYQQQVQEFEDFDSLSPEEYSKCHRQTFDTLPKESKVKVARRFVKILKEERGEYVLGYENLFFRASDMEYLPPNEAALAKAHLLSRVDKEQTEAVLGVVEGLGRFLTDGEVRGLVDAYARMIAYGKSDTIKTRARALLSVMNFETDGDVNKQVQERLDNWISFLGEKGLSEPKTVLEEIKSQWTEEIPF